MERNLDFSGAAVTRLRMKLTWAQLEIVTADAEDFKLFIAGDDESVEELRAEMSEGDLIVAQPQLGYAKEILPRRRWLQIGLRVPQAWRGELDVDSIAGMVGAHKIRCKQMELSTVSGQIHADGIECDLLEIHTVAGVVNGDGLKAQRGHFRTVSGRMALNDLTLKEGKGTTMSGEMNLSLNEGCKTLDFQSVSGAICVEVEGPAKGSLRSLSGQFLLGGDVHQEPGCLEIIGSSVTGDLAVKARRA